MEYNSTKIFLETLASAINKVIEKAELMICNIDHSGDHSCTTFLNQLEIFVNEAKSSVFSQRVDRWEAPAKEVLYSASQCTGK